MFYGEFVKISYRLSKMGQKIELASGFKNWHFWKWVIWWKEAAILPCRTSACRMAVRLVVRSCTSIRMWLFQFNVLAFLFIFLRLHSVLALQDVTTDLFGAENYGTVAAFGDFYADKQTDIFIIRERMLTIKNSALFAYKLFAETMCGLWNRARRVHF